MKKPLGGRAAVPSSDPQTLSEEPGFREWVAGQLLPRHQIELLDGSGIAPDVAALNLASFGPGTGRHWEQERAELVAHARTAIQISSTTVSGHPQIQPGHLSARLNNLDQRYRHLQAGGWRTLSDTLPGLPVFDQWKPDSPRQKGRRDAAGGWLLLAGHWVKYEAGPGFPDGGGLLLPRIPERCWRLICQRQGLPFPDAAAREVGFWLWALATPELLLVIAEGPKKALAAVSAGWPAVGLPGVQMGRRLGADGSERLIEALQLLNTPGRRWVIAFDAEAKASTAAKVGAAAGALARTLRAAGGRPEIARLPLLPGTIKTGLDDLLVAAGPEALDRALAATGPRPVMPRLRPADRTAPAGQYLGAACTIPSPEVARLVALAAPMGAGKTEAIKRHRQALPEGVPVLEISHRSTLAETMAEALGLPTGDDARPGSPLRHLGAGCCIDSLCPQSALQIRPEEWRGCVVVIDELVQVLAHALTCTGTAIAKRRAAVLETLSAILRDALQVIVADALLADWALAVIESLVGCRAHLIASDHRPAAGAQLVWFPKRKQWIGALARHLQQQTRLLIWTTAQQVGQGNAAQTIAGQVAQHWPAARVLVVDSNTSKTEGHPAERFAADPNGVSAAHDVVICTPAVTSGVSIDRLADHFGAVFLATGGLVPPEDVIQAAGRLRTTAPRYLYCPDRTPGRALRMGSGAFKADEVLRHLSDHERLTVGQLAQAGAIPSQALTGPWLPAWAELATIRNRQDLAYRATVLALLEREGYEVAKAASDATETALGWALADDLKATAEQQLAAEDAAIIAAPLLTAEDAEAIGRKRRRSPGQAHQLRRFEVDRTWALHGATPSAELLAADRDGQVGRLRRRFWLTTGRALVAAQDRRAAQEVAPTGRHLPWDLARCTVGPAIKAAEALGLPDWANRADWFTAEDAQLLKLQATAEVHRAALVQVLGVGPGKKATGTLRALLRAFGYRLEARRSRVAGDRSWRYRVVPEALPDGRQWAELAGRWADEVSQKIPLEKKGESGTGQPPVGALVEVLTGDGWRDGWQVLELDSDQVVVGHADGTPGHLTRPLQQIRPCSTPA